MCPVLLEIKQYSSLRCAEGRIIGSNSSETEVKMFMLYWPYTPHAYLLLLCAMYRKKEVILHGHITHPLLLLLLFLLLLYVPQQKLPLLSILHKASPSPSPSPP